jgi:hypothetical protein
VGLELDGHDGMGERKKKGEIGVFIQKAKGESEIGTV